jgi:hypothetical protein
MAKPGTSGKRPLWRCPKCGHEFVTRNLWHSCARYRLEDHFAGKPPELRQAFDRYVEIARACGPVTVYAQKTRIVIQARVRFAGAIVRGHWLDAGMWLKRRVEHPLLVRVESFGRLGYGHHFRLRSAADVDEALAQLMREAYAVGQQEAAGDDGPAG